MTNRAPSAVDDVADSYFDESMRLDPFAATIVGIAGMDGQVTDYSPDAVDARVELARNTLAQAGSAPVRDDVDRVTLASLQDRLGLVGELHDAGQLCGPLNVISTPVQEMRMVFDLMPTATAQDWATIATRMRRLPASVESYTQALRRAISQGNAPARRQVEAVIAQCRQMAEPGSGTFFRLVGSAKPESVESASLANDLECGAREASTAFETLATALAEEVLPAAREGDAFGTELYALHSREYVSATLDLRETYEWGLAELARVEAEMAAVADQIVRGGSVDDAVHALDTDPTRRIAGAEAFRDWMQLQADRAIEELGGTHFDIPEQIATIECCLAPAAAGGIYYTGPSEDFSRPGRMWWAVPESVTEFSTWRELTTVFHEGVPGHHLQIGQAMVRSDVLNRWRRMGTFISGHGEGWALYAERLMADLGYLDDPGDRLGMLDGSAFRAMRVVVDIGVHCGFSAPAEVGGGIWDADKMWQYMRAHCRMQEAFLEFEHLRYLGWPGQAPSYKIGERLWRQVRDDTAAAAGDSFDLKDFHRRALDLGCVPLDVLASALRPSS